jgi:anti-anti-sigma regulatory factor
VAAALARAAARTPGPFVVDLTGVIHLDSSALAALWKYVERRPLLVVRADSIVQLLTRLGFAGLDMLQIEP